jgi:arginyl-tRNA synthetase
MIKQKLQKAIGEVLADLNIEISDFGLEYPTDFAHGDLSSNVAMIHAKISKQNPRELAEKIVEKLNEFKKDKKLTDVEKIEIAGPGFINFHLSREFFTKNIEQILEEGSNYGKNTLHKGEKIMIEHTNLNPFKPFHIGHLVNHSVGESISRLLENSGAEVKRVSYGGDVGLHVAKTIWGMMDHPYGQAPKNGEILEEPITYIGRVYAEGDKAFESDPILAQSIKDINKKIFERSDEGINKLYDWGRAESLKYFEKVYAMLEMKFAYQFFESEMAPIGMFIVEEFLQKGIFEKSEGAIVFKGEQYGLHTRVFVNSQGLPTYETKDLGLTKRKMELYLFDLSIVVTANEQNDYFKVLLKVIEFVFPEIASKMRHISHGFLRLPTGKMSSRKGGVITGEALIHDVKNIVSDKISNRELTADEKRNVLDTVAIAAIKFSILKQSPGSDIIFDLEKSLSFEGDSGPYLQYSTVRAQSVLHKAVKEKIPSFTKGFKLFSRKNKIPETVSEFEKLLSRFQDVANHATVELAPQHIVTYLLQLSGAFNSYYATNKIVDAIDGTSSYKVAMTKSFVQIMSHGLYLLGISVPEKM